MKLKPIVTAVLLCSSLLAGAAEATPRRRFVFNFQPPTLGTPSHTIGGAIRGDFCAADRTRKESMTLYVADEGKTQQSHPTFIGSIPQLNSDKSATLIVKDETEDYYIEQPLTVPAGGGRIAVTLDEAHPALEVGTEYQFFLRLQCGEIAKVEDPVVSGAITRVAGTAAGQSADLMSQDSSSLLDLLTVYNSQDLWFDTLALAARLDDLGDGSYFDAMLESIQP